MPATVIVGAQWGDEGKGKIVDLLARHSDLVCRYQGGPNAGHTIIADGQTYKLHHIPSGILYPDTLCVLGAGCVVDPDVLIRELDELEARGVSTEPIRVSGNAHLVMPWHVALDQASERRLGKLQIGTTRRGIGPAYADKYGQARHPRPGPARREDPPPEDRGRARREERLARARLRRGAARPRRRRAAARSAGRRRLAPYVADTSLLVDEALGRGSRVLLEGAQGTLLDVDHGTYPFVTSSNPIAGGACTGVGIGPTRIDEVLGVAKAYVTRVGEGPFPTEIAGAGPGARARARRGVRDDHRTGAALRLARPRRAALRGAASTGITSLALTKLDVLSAFAEIPVCVALPAPGRHGDGGVPRPSERLPSRRARLRDAAGLARGARRGRRLATSSRRRHGATSSSSRSTSRYQVSLVGTGAERERVLARHGLAALPLVA